MHKGTDNAEGTDAQDTENACKIATDQRIQKIKYREYTRDREEEYTENREDTENAEYREYRIPGNIGGN